MNYIEKIQNSKSVALFSHQNPDPDTIGSTLALFNILKIFGKKVDLFCDNGESLPKSYFVFEDVKFYNPTIKNYDLLISVDVPAAYMLGKYEEFFKNHKNTIRIDHHALGEKYAKINKVKTNSACAINIFELSKKLKVTLNPKIATLLYFGICGDTGIFKYNNTDSKTFLVASKLLALGADFKFVYEEFFNKRTVPFVKISSNCILNAKLDDNFGYVVLRESLCDMKKFGATTEDDVSNLSHQYLNCGYKIGVVLKEREDGIHCSFRSKFEYDCSVISNVFGGGGHKNAAGAVIKTSLDEAEKLVSLEIEKYLKNFKEKK